MTREEAERRESNMSDDGHNEAEFDVIRQFVIAPDRRYRVEWRDTTLLFRKTGSQFDTRWLARGARPLLGDRVAEAFERSGGRPLVLGGIGLAVVAALLLLLVGAWATGTTAPIRWPHLTGIGVLGFGFILGLVMTIAGIATRRGSESARHDFSLPLDDIVSASVLPPQSELARRGEPQVARLCLEARTGGTIKLGIPTASDLEVAQRAIPRMAA